MDHQALNRFRNLLIVLTLFGFSFAAGVFIKAAIPTRDAPWRAVVQGRTQAQLAAAQIGEAERRVPSALLSPPEPREDLMESPFVKVADAVIPAVVSIEGYRVMDISEADERHRDIFERLYPRGDGEEGFEIPSSGSGFIIDEEGFVLTNDHVVSGAGRILVHLADGRAFDAYLLGTDPGTDVAVLKIQREAEETIPVLPLGNSDEMRVGDWAIAVGNPLGELESSFTVGVISATGRTNLQIAGGGPTYQNFIQTDASINFGNSGGPLVNVRGEAIGINSAVNPTGQGLGFAIPINMAREVAVELVRSGTIRRGFLGIVPIELSAESRQQFGIDEEVRGVLVTNVQDDSPAERGGLRDGDVILEFNHQAVSDVPEFRRIVAESGVGNEVSMVLVSDGEERSVTVTLDLRPDTVDPPADIRPFIEEDWLGAEFEEISPEHVALFNLGLTEGVVLTRISMGRAAARSGLRLGDVVLSINDSRVRDMKEFETALTDGAREGTPLRFQVQRGANTSDVIVGFDG